MNSESEKNVSKKDREGVIESLASEKEKIK